LIQRNSSGTSVELEAGQHTVRLVNADAIDKEILDDIIVTADTTIALSYSFRFPSSASRPTTQTRPAATQGELTIGSKPTIGADIYIDGELQSRKTPSAFKLAPGLHRIRAVLIIDGNPQQRADSVTIAAGASEKIIFDFEK
jgi:hypothetical protein